MDHRYIDERSVADRYLDHRLSSRERAEFEAHIVDCQECTDRLLLAEMFHNRNGVSRAAPAYPSPVPPPAPPVPAPEPRALRIRFVRRFTPVQFFLALCGAAALLVLLTASLLLWALRFGSVLH
jgi:anti-sigma factor RsiW